MQDLRDEIAAVKADMSSLKMGVDNWSRTFGENMQKEIAKVTAASDAKFTDLEDKLSNFQLNGTSQLQQLEQKFEERFATVMAGLNALGDQIRNASTGPPPPPGTTGVHCGSSGQPGGGSDGGGANFSANTTSAPCGQRGQSVGFPNGRVSIPIPKGMHGIPTFDGKNYLVWKQSVIDHVTDEGRDEIKRLIKWAEKQKDVITKDSEKHHDISDSTYPFEVEQASAEIYRTLGRVLPPEIAMKYRTNAGEGCGLEAWRKLFQDNEGISDQVTDVQFKQFTLPARTKSIEELAKILPEWETVGIRLEAAGENISDRQRQSALMQLVPDKLEELIRNKQMNHEIVGYKAIVTFVKNHVTERNAERNASQLSFGPKIAGSNGKGKHANDMDIGSIGHEGQSSDDSE